MEQRGGRSDARLQQEADAARGRVEELERRVQEQREEVEVLKEQLDRSKRDIRDEKRRTDDANKAAKAAEDDLRGSRSSCQPSVVTTRLNNATSQPWRLAWRSAQEVARYQKENRLVGGE